MVYLGQTLSLVLPTFKEKNSIRNAIISFQKLGIFDYIFVVNNNAEEGTLKELEGLDVEIVHEFVQGYGAALKSGIKQTQSDLVIICEPDGTFFAEDTFKLLAYSNECDVVFGSRTVQTFIWGDANMGWFLRWGNWFVAKLLEITHNTSYMSDVGCTFRLFNRKAINVLNLNKLSNSSSFGLEMQVAVVRDNRLKYVQIPIRYGERVGDSTITGSFKKSLLLGLKMILIILNSKFFGRSFWFEGRHNLPT